MRCQCEGLVDISQVLVIHTLPFYRYFAQLASCSASRLCYKRVGRRGGGIDESRLLTYTSPSLKWDKSIESLVRAEN
jgi:hypothetical protein